MKKSYILQKFRIIFFALFVAVTSLIQGEELSPISKKKNLNQEERYWMTKFFRNFMLAESSIYVLLGSKPMTWIPLFYPKNKEERPTKEELQKCQAFFLNRDKKEDLQFYKTLSSKEKKKTYLVSDENYIYNWTELWENWTKIEHRFPLNKRFILVKKPRKNLGCPHVPKKYTSIVDVYFVDIMKTALIIQEHYLLFKRLLGFDFDPFQVVFELEAESSPFWDELTEDFIGKYDVLWGILFGFGRENAVTFGWWYSAKFHNKGTKRGKDLAKDLLTWTSTKRKSSFPENIYTIENFEIPAFRSFSKDDPVVKKYEKEKKMIQNRYRGKDFLDFTLELLTENSLSAKEANTPLRGKKEQKE